MPLFLLFVTLTATAENDIIQRDCRRGVQRTHLLKSHRTGGQPRQVGGDFYTGDRHQLTILVSFGDRSFKGNETETLDQWNKIFNEQGLSESPFKGSVHDYFLAQSYGDFRLTFDLQYVVVSGNAAKYASTQADDENSQFLVNDIMAVLETRDIDWSQYDWNGDGYINQLLIIYAGHGMNDTHEANLIWPHQWWLSEHVNPTTKEYCQPRVVNQGGLTYSVDCYCALAELTSKNDYGSFGTICHEYSHCFGFPDFYGGSRDVRYWDLMDYGNYNGGGYCPTSYSAHERWLMGWLTPTELHKATTITNMPALTDEPVAYLIRNDGHTDEYYLVENRQQTGWDASTPGKGLVVFHVDYDASIWTSTVDFPNTQSYQRYTIIPANNRTSYSTSSNWPYPNNGNCELTNTSSPAAALNHSNVDGEMLMSKPLTNMAVSDGLASFDFMGGSTAVRQLSADSTPATILYRMGNVRIVRFADGSIRKVAAPAK